MPTLTAGADGPTATVTLQLTNTGAREGAEVVQAYVRPLKPPVVRPEKELKAFAPREPHAGRDEDRHAHPRPARLRLLRPRRQGLARAKGRYELLVGSSSRDIRLTGSVEVTKAALLR